MPEPVEATRWGARAVDTGFVRVYINGLLFDFDPRNAAALAQTIRVILGTDDAPSGADRRTLLRELTQEAIEAASYGEPAPASGTESHENARTGLNAAHETREAPQGSQEAAE